MSKYCVQTVYNVGFVDARNTFLSRRCELNPQTQMPHNALHLGALRWGRRSCEILSKVKSCQCVILLSLITFPESNLSDYQCVVGLSNKTCLEISWNSLPSCDGGAGGVVLHLSFSRQYAEHADRACSMQYAVC